MRTIQTILLIIWSIASMAQHGKTLEEVVAVVGEHIILKSDLETEYTQAKSQMEVFEGDLKCEILHQLIIQHLYLHKGDIDSVVVAPERVDAEVDRRIKYYAAQIGGERLLENYLGKPLDEYREMMGVKIKEQMIIQQVQQGLMKDVKVSPTQVKAFFQAIPKDSLPHFEQEVEVAQIIMKPEPSDIAKKLAYDKLAKIRKDILSGLYTFEFAARTKSDDKGTAVNGGDLGYFTRGEMVSAFERTAFKMKKDSISEIFETEYGYHIIQLIDRKGEKVNARHILIKPLIVDSDLEKVRKRMVKLIADIKADSTDLCRAATEYSEDPYTKDNCGFFIDQTTGAQNVAISNMDPAIIAVVKSMSEGQYSAPIRLKKDVDNDAYRFLFLQKIIPEHQANLQEDYQKIQKMALAQAQDEYVMQWVDKYKAGVYIWIDEKYANCEELASWKGLN